jgi:uncharacterized protein (TIGR02246 family)
MSFEAPERLHEAFAGALADWDVDTALGLYTADAVSIGPDGAEARGRDALGSMLTALIGGDNAMQGTQRRTVVVDDLALTSTTWTAHWPTEDGTTLTQNGITAEVSRRQPDGTWKVVIDSPFFA